MPDYRPAEIVGDIVDALRAQRRGGDSASALLHYLGDELGMRDADATRYFDAAFVFTSGRPSLELLRGEDGSLDERFFDMAFGAAIDKSRAAWEAAGPYPDLMRRRDRHAFRSVAMSANLIIGVKAADRRNGHYIGLEGFRPSPPRLHATPRTSGPNRGLMAADPGTPAGPTPYADYVKELERLGFRVEGPEWGHIVRDTAGNVFYPGYELLGVYSGTNRRSAWTSKDGERIRAMLNRRLGEDLIQRGPQHHAEGHAHRAEAPFPALFFMPNGDVETRRTLDAVKSFYVYNGLGWNGLNENATPQLAEP